MTLTDDPEYDIRYTHEKDVEILRTWFESQAMRHWYPPTTEQELDNFLRVWMGYAKFKAGLSATYKNETIGMGILYLMPYKKIAHQAMFQVIVSPAYQRRGVGKSLVRNLMHHAKNRFRIELLHVEILDESGLIPLLKSLDFDLYATQKGYIKENDKYFSRFLMERDL